MDQRWPLRLKVHLDQGAMGGLDGSVAAEQSALPEQVVAQAGAIDALSRFRVGPQAGRPGRVRPLRFVPRPGFDWPRARHIGHYPSV